MPFINVVVVSRWMQKKAAPAASDTKHSIEQGLAKTCWYISMIASTSEIDFDVKFQYCQVRPIGMFWREVSLNDKHLGVMGWNFHCHAKDWLDLEQDYKSKSNNTGGTTLKYRQC